MLDSSWRYRSVTGVLLASITKSIDKIHDVPRVTACNSSVATQLRLNRTACIPGLLLSGFALLWSIGSTAFIFSSIPAAFDTVCLGSFVVVSLPKTPNSRIIPTFILTTSRYYLLPAPKDPLLRFTEGQPAAVLYMRIDRSIVYPYPWGTVP